MATPRLSPRDETNASGSRPALRRAARVLRGGGVVAYPTEGVYGLGCLPWRADAVQRITRLKGRSKAQGFVLIGADLAQLGPYLLDPLPAKWRRQLIASWPAALTWVVPCRPGTPSWLTGGGDTIAVRVPDHALARALCAATGSALVSTSANRSGRPPARSALAARRLFGLDIDYILSGRIGGASGPSEIRDLASGRILRPARPLP